MIPLTLFSRLKSTYVQNLARQGKDLKTVQLLCLTLKMSFKLSNEHTIDYYF